MKKINLLILGLFLTSFSFAQSKYDGDGLPRFHDRPSAEEIEFAKQTNFVLPPMAPAPPPSGELRPVAEFEPAEAVLIRYPFHIPMLLIQKLAEEINVITIVANPSEKTTVTNQYLSNGIDTSKCSFLIAPTNSEWTRDYGPWFMAIDDEKVGMFDFTYNRAKYPYNRYNDNAINGHLAPFLSLDRYVSSYYLTGGNYMNDGTSQAASSVQQFYEDNPGVTIPTFRAHFLEYLGIEQYHFPDDALGQYINHIDCWAKYLGPNKIMIGEVPPGHPRYQAYEDAVTYFASQTSPWGMPMQVYRVYTPGGSGTKTTPYTNSLILNDRVFVPQTGNQYDEDAMDAYRNAMPGYKVIGINYNDWLNTDALHCRTHEIADRGMLYIKHLPLFGEQSTTDTYTIYADISPYSGEALVEDSLLVYYKIGNAGEWQTQPMTHVSEKTWRGDISCVPEESDVSYYIFAKDESGRRECHPYIGAPDPHRFHAQPTTPNPAIAVSETEFEVAGLNNVDLTFEFAISNGGCGDLTYELSEGEPSAKNGFLLTFEPQTGAVSSGSSQTISVTVHSKDLPAGSYNTSILIASNDPVSDEPELPVLVTIYNGIVVPDTVYVVQNETNPAFFTISCDYNTDVVIESIDFAHGDPFEGTVTPADGATFPVTVSPSQEITFKAEYTGGEDAGNEILYSTYTVVSDVISREVVIVFIPDGVGIDEQQIEKQSVVVFPNPATNSVSFVYSTAEPTSAVISIYDITGKPVKQISHESSTSGAQTVTWNFENETMLNGMYFYSIRLNEQIVNGKLLIMR
jgi:agmatine/peptidylarginine deiminase